MTGIDADTLYSTSEAARRLGVSRQSVCNWLTRLAVPVQRAHPRAHRRILGRDLLAMLARQPLGDSAESESSP